MKTKIAPAMTVLSVELKTNLESLMSDVGDIPKNIYCEAVKHDLVPSGPMQWIYKWEQNDPNSDFVLKVTLPVALFGKTYKGTDFKLENLDAFKCVATQHFGSWDNLNTSYGKLMDRIKANGLVQGSTSRELYLNCDFEKVENNITEIQFEVN